MYIFGLDYRHYLKIHREIISSRWRNPEKLWNTGRVMNETLLECCPA